MGGGREREEGEGGGRGRRERGKLDLKCHLPTLGQSPLTLVGEGAVVERGGV